MIYAYLAHEVMAEYIKRYPEQRRLLDISFFRSLPDDEQQSIYDAAKVAAARRMPEA